MFWLQTLKEKLMSKYIKSIVQHALTALGAILVAKGILDPDDVQQFVDTNVAVLVGAITYGLGQIWDIKTKK